MSYIVIETEILNAQGEWVDVATTTYEIDTPSGERRAREAIREAGLDSLPVWYGHPDDPNSYRSSVSRLFASK